MVKIRAMKLLAISATASPAARPGVRLATVARAATARGPPRSRTSSSSVERLLAARSQVKPCARSCAARPISLAPLVVAHQRADVLGQLARDRRPAGRFARARSTRAARPPPSPRWAWRTPAASITVRHQPSADEAVRLHPGALEQLELLLLATRARASARGRRGRAPRSAASSCWPVIALAGDLQHRARVGRHGVEQVARSACSASGGRGRAATGRACAGPARARRRRAPRRCSPPRSGHAGCRARRCRRPTRWRS